MPAIYVPIRAERYERLRELAAANHRRPHDQAAWILERALDRSSRSRDGGSPLTANPPQMAARPLITVGAAAQLLGRSKSATYELARRGELPGCVLLNGRFWVRSAVLERWLSGEDEPLPKGPHVEHPEHA